MNDGDFFHNEKSICLKDDTNVKIEFISELGKNFVLKDPLPLLSNEIIDASVMSKRSLLSFLEREIKDFKDSGILLSLHMKATIMMKVSDPIIFSYVVKVFFSDLIEKHFKTFDELGVDFKNGFGDLISKIQNLPIDIKRQIERDIEMHLRILNLAMVDSDKGITNLHVPSDVIIDASILAMIRNSGQMWNKDNKTEDTKSQLFLTVLMLVYILLPLIFVKNMEHLIQQQWVPCQM